MGIVSDGIGYLSRNHEAAKAQRAERRRLAAEQREEERKRREAEHQELLARLTERFRKQYGWDLAVTGYYHDDWGDPVYLLDNGSYMTVTERNPLLYRKKPVEDPFREVHEAWRTERLTDEITAKVVRAMKPDTEKN